MESFYRMKITMGRVMIELESHDMGWINEKEKSLLADLLSHPEAISKSEIAADSRGQETKLQIGAEATINEYYRKHVAKESLSRPDIALMLFYYLEKIRGQAEIATTDIKAAFKEIAFPRYDKMNFTDTLNSLKNRGFLNKDGKTWKLTLTGIDYILTSMSQE